MTIPVRKLVWTSVLTAVSSTALIGFLMVVSVKNVPNLTRILIDTVVAIFVAGMIHMQIIRYIRQKGQRWKWYKKATIRFGGTFVLIVIYNFIVNVCIDSIFDPAELSKLTTLRGINEQLVGAIIILGLILISHNQVLMRQRRIDAELELSEIRAANIEATNRMLQQQIQPHFLFNALSILNSLYKRDYHTGNAYMLHLSGFLRASISSTKHALLTIGEEIKICNDYVAMQQIRFNGALNFKTRIDENMITQGRLPSFSIQPLIENAIKHNQITSEQPLLVELFTEDGYLNVKNNIIHLSGPVVSTGQGLANLRKRYELISGDEVEVTNDGTSFNVKLKILRSEHRNH